MREPRFSSAEPSPSSFDADYNPREVRDIIEFRRDQAKLRRSIESQDLPIRNRLEELTNRLIESANGKGTLLLKAETGAGKSVYSPVALRAALKKLGRPDKIIILQPKRDAASGVASAVAAVMEEELGRGVGFSTSEAKVVKTNSAVRVVTPGILVRYLQRGWLTKEQIGALVIDEVHEPSIDYHLALALIKKLQDEGKAPLTLLTSATPNTEILSKHFGLEKTDIMNVEGRAYPVEKNYIPEEELKRFERHERGYLDLVTREVRKFCEKTTDGDVLVFLSGSGEIHDVMNRLRSLPDVEVLPLYGRLKPSERARALNSDGSKTSRRRIILSTNIAETSVTVPGVKYVIDSCRERISSYNQQEAVRETPTVFITKGTAEQRAGRAGRVEGGACVRLISKERYEELPEHQIAEIHRSNLTQLVLKIKGMGLDPLSFKLPEPPPPGALEKGITDLQHLGALDENGNLTERGMRMKDMAHFSPEISGMILKAEDLGCRTAALAVAAFEREDKVFPEPDSDMINRFGRDEVVDQIEWRHRQTFGDHDSDFIKSLAVFREALKQGVVEAMNRENLPSGYYAREKFTRWCQANSVSPAALTHIAYRLSDYAYKDENNNQHDKDQEHFSYNGLNDLLEKTNLADLSRAILAGHADRLMYYVKDPSGKRGSYRRLGDPATAIGLSSDSATYKSVVIGDDPSNWGARTHENRQPPALCIAGSIDKKEDGGYKAKKIHPVTLAELMEVTPHLVTCEEIGKPFYDDSLGAVTVKVQVALRENNQAVLGTIERPKTGPEAVQAFAEALAGDLVMAGDGLEPPFDFIQLNRSVLKRLAELEKRFAGIVQKPSVDFLTSWYTKHLGTMTSFKDITEVKRELYLKLDDFVTPKELRDLEVQFPSVISLDGTVVYPVTYQRIQNYSSPHAEGLGDGEEKKTIFMANITGFLPEALSDEAWERLYAVSDEHLPKLGSAEHSVQMTFEATNARGEKISFKNWTELKTVFDEKRLFKRRAEAEISAKNFCRKNILGEPNPRGVYFWRLDQKIPDLDSSQLAPIVLPPDRQGNSPMLYPAIIFLGGVSSDGNALRFQLDVILTKTAAEAETMQRRSLNEQEKNLRSAEEARRAVERQKNLADVSQQLKKLHSRSLGTLVIPTLQEMEKIYHERLVPLTDVWRQKNEDVPKLTVEDFISPERLNAFETEFPVRIFLGGQSYEVAYKPSASQEGLITASIKMHGLDRLSDDEWNRIYDLTDVDLPKLGSTEHPVQCVFSLGDARGLKETPLEWKEFKTAADRQRLEESHKKILEGVQKRYDRLVFGNAQRNGAYYELPITSAIFSAEAPKMPPIVLPADRAGDAPTMFAVPEIMSDVKYDSYRSTEPVMNVRLCFVSSAEKADEIRQKNEVRRIAEAERYMPLYEKDREKIVRAEQQRKIEENRHYREQFVKKNEESYTLRRFPEKNPYSSTASISLNQPIPVLDNRQYLHIVLPPDSEGKRLVMYPAIKVISINGAESGRPGTAAVRVVFVDSEEKVRAILQEQQSLPQEWRRLEEMKPEIEAVKKTADDLKKLFDRIKHFQAFGKESGLTGYRYQMPLSVTPEEFEDVAKVLKGAQERLPNDQPPFFSPGKGMAEAHREIDQLHERFKKTLETFKVIEQINQLIKEKMGNESTLTKSLRERGLNESSAQQFVVEATGTVAQYIKNKQMYYLDGKPEAGDPVERLTKVLVEVESVYSVSEFLAAHVTIENLIREHRQALREQPRDYQLWTPPPTAEEVAEAARQRQAAHRPVAATPASLGSFGDRFKAQKPAVSLEKSTGTEPSVKKAETAEEMSEERQVYKMLTKAIKGWREKDNKKQVEEVNALKKTPAEDPLAALRSKIDALSGATNHPREYDAAWPAKFTLLWQDAPRLIQSYPDAQAIVDSRITEQMLTDALRKKIAASIDDWMRPGYTPPTKDWLEEVVYEAIL